MLVLSRKLREAVVIGGDDGLQCLLTVTVLGIHGTTVKLGFEVDAHVPVHRVEVWGRLQAERQRTRPASRPAATNQEMARWEDDGGGHPASRPRESRGSEVP